MDGKYPVRRTTRTIRRVKGRRRRTPPVVLSIAGYDPSSGAGITADIKTIAAHGCYGVTCITALTVQSTQGVRKVEPVAGPLIAETLEELARDVEIAAVKIGMLGSAEAARAVAQFLHRLRPGSVVLDPVLRSSSGTQLLSQEGLWILKGDLLPLASVITPNVDEASVLAGVKITNVAEMKQASAALRTMGARNVIITGGHLDPPADLVDEAGRQTLVKGKRISTTSTHGTGCAYSTALACNLALGRNLVDAAKAAKKFVETVLRNPPHVGKGSGPVV